MLVRSKILERARDIAARYSGSATSPYLNVPLRTVEEASADIETSRKRWQGLIHGCPSRFGEGR